MNLSNDTISILKNFSDINQNILVKPGSKLQTISTLKNILAEVKARDKVDSKRKISPLVKVKSAHLISNHTKYISTPVMKIIKLIKKVS